MRKCLWMRAQHHRPCMHASWRDSIQVLLPAMIKKLLPVASLAHFCASNNPAATCPSIFYSLSSSDQPPNFASHNQLKGPLPRGSKSSQGRMEERRQASQPDPRVPVPMLNAQDSESCPILFEDPSFCVIKCLECSPCTGSSVLTNRDQSGQNRKGHICGPLDTA